MSFRVLVALVCSCSLLSCGDAASSPPEAEDTPFRVGFARTDVTPTIVDTWTDADGDGRYDPAAGDSFEDRNGDGAFEAFVLPGDRRPATGVHAPLSATALVMTAGDERLAIVSVDAYGLVFDDVEFLRDTLPEAWGVTDLMVSSTGARTTPNLVDGWASVEGVNSLNEAYHAFLLERVVEAVGAAVEALRPAEMELVEVEDGTAGLVVDRRPPDVVDPAIRALRFVGTEGEVIGTLVNWSAPADAAGAETLTIGPDYPGALRARVESHTGGTALFVVGATGGGLEIETDRSGHAAAEAAGRSVANAFLSGIEAGLQSRETPVSLRVFSSELRLPLDNERLKRRIRAGEIRRGMTTDSLLSTELQIAVVGGAWLLALPGEVFPEHLNGGIIELPEGDYTGGIEQPPMRTALKGTVNFAFGNTNDAIGPIIPLVEWDAEPPFLGNAPEAWTDETRTVTPVVARLIQRGFISMMRSAMPYYRRTQEEEDIER